MAIQIQEKHRKEIEHIIADLECPKETPCYRSEFKNLGKAKDAGLDNFTYCSEGDLDAILCHFSMSFGEKYLCKCPLRIYLAKHLNI